MLGVREFKSGKTYNPDNKKNRKQTVVASGIILNEDYAKQSLQNISASAKNPITTSEEQNKHSETHKSKQVLKDAEPKGVIGRIRTRGRNSVGTNPNSTQDDGEHGNNSNLPRLPTSDTQSTEKDSLNKNVVPTSTPKTATTSELNSLKTLETYIETMGIDVPPNRYLLAYNRVGKVGLSLFTN